MNLQDLSSLFNAEDAQENSQLIEILLPANCFNPIIHRTSPHSWLVRVRTPFEGKTLSRRLIVHGTRFDAIKAEIRFRDELAQGKKTR
jgi:hypothetical protein